MFQVFAEGKRRPGANFHNAFRELRKKKYAVNNKLTLSSPNIPANVWITVFKILKEEAKKYT
jgi:hypothetical protein